MAGQPPSTTTQSPGNGSSTSIHNPANSSNTNNTSTRISPSAAPFIPSTPSKHSSLPPRPESPAAVLTSPLSGTPTRQRVSSPTFNRRGSPSIGGGLSSSSVGATPQRPSSRGAIAIRTPTSSSNQASTEAALSSLQELIKSMPSASTPTKEYANQFGSTNNDREKNVMSPTSQPTSQPTTRSRATSASNSTLNPNAGGFQPNPNAGGFQPNPNAGGFQPGALSALGEVEHEALVTPQVSSFDSGISSNAYLAQLQQQYQQQQASQSQTSTVGNVFGSPLQTPQNQIGAGHHTNYAAANPQEWQNYHNVFNAGIGNAASPSTNNTGGLDQSGMNNLALLAAMQGMNLGNAGGATGMDASTAAAAAAMGLGGANPLLNMSMQAQAQMALYQQLQQQQQQLGFQSSPQQQQAQQQALALQQQFQLQQTLLQAQIIQQQQQQQAQAVAQANVASPGGANANAASSVPPRFAQATTAQQQSPQADINAATQASINVQLELESLRLAQENIMQRYAQLGIVASPISQVQAAQAAVGMANSPIAAAGNALPDSSVTSNSATAATATAPATPARAGAAVTLPSAAAAAHRRGQSVAAQASTGPMGQFGSMGQFALPSATAGSASSTTGSILPKGHGRRHSVNVKGNNGSVNTINSAFSFPTGANNPTQQMHVQGTNAPAPIIGNDVNNPFVVGMGGLPTTMEVAESPADLPPNAAQRALGHGRRESRGSIGSLAGWGSNSNIVTQSSVPVSQTNVTDLAQAQAQLHQLTQFRASAGHSRVPSFGVQQMQGTPSQQQRKSLFAPYLPAASIPPLLQTGKLVIGVLRVNKRNRSDAYVATDVLNSDVFICGSKDRNRALEGDVVAVELLDVDDVWGTKKEKEEKKRKKEESTAFDPRFTQQLRKQDKKKDDVEVEGQGLTLFEDEEVNDDQRPTYAGHVVAVVERQAGQLFAGTLGILRPSSAATKEKQDAERRERDGVDIRNDDRQNRPKIIWFKPVDKRVPLVAIPADQAPESFLDSPDKFNSTLFVACIKRWPITSLHPFGSLVEELGEIGDIEAETNALLKDCGFTDETFGETVAKCLPPTPWTIPQSEIEARKDFRQCRVFTIDPETARDLDDALHINKLDDGTFEVGVHIADVSHFVKPNSALDREAKRRGTTVYLVQRASPMLPQTLSEALCSLQPGEDRLTFSAVFKMSAEGRVLSTWFGKSVIKSAAKLAYSNAQVCIEGKDLPESVKIFDDHDPEGIAADIRHLDSMARQMRARRFDNGALRIDNVKLSFTLDEDGRPVDCKVYERQESHSLIEEFMLLANQAVATKIASALPDQALLRRHEAPIARRLEGFGKRADKLGYQMDTQSAGTLMTSFNRLKQDDPVMVLRLLATKSMLQAKYICSGMYDIADYHHYALNVPLYTHFSSPIRRYADVIVHRQLEAALSESPEARFTMDSETVSKVCQNSNNRKMAAKTCQEQSQHLHLCILISDLTAKYGQVRRQATVVGVLDASFDVVVPDFGIEKRVHLDQLPLHNYVHDERTNVLSLYWEEGQDSIKYLAASTKDPYIQRIKEVSDRHAAQMGTSTKDVSAEAALFEDDDEEGEIPEVQNKTTSIQVQKSLNRAPVSKDGCEKTAAGQCLQVIKELSQVTVVVLADTSASPGVIRLSLGNPYAS